MPPLSTVVQLGAISTIHFDEGRLTMKRRSELEQGSGRDQVPAGRFGSGQALELDIGRSPTGASYADTRGELCLYTVSDVCRITQLSRAKVALLLSSGALPSLKIGKSRRIEARALERWIAELADEP